MKRGFVVLTEGGSCRVDEDSEAGLIVLVIRQSGVGVEHAMRPFQARLLASELDRLAREMKKDREARS